jgi:hypothetical protein
MASEVEGKVEPEVKRLSSLIQNIVAVTPKACSKDYENVARYMLAVFARDADATLQAKLVEKDAESVRRDRIEEDLRHRIDEVVTQRDLFATTSARFLRRALAAEATAARLQAERDGDVAKAVAEWTKPQTLKLHAGEMTAGEVRTCQAVLRGFAAAIRTRPALTGESDG